MTIRRYTMCDGHADTEGNWCWYDDAKAEIIRLKIANGDLLRGNLSFARAQALSVLDKQKRAAEITRLTESLAFYREASVAHQSHIDELLAKVVHIADTLDTLMPLLRSVL